MASALPHDHPDRPTVEALRCGDQTAFRALVNDLNPGLIRMARGYVPDALAEEVVQETWVAVVKSIGGFEGRAALKTWIYRILLNKVRTLAARENKVVPFAALGPHTQDSKPSVDPDRLVHPELGRGYWPDAPPQWETNPTDRLEASETVKRIASAIAALPPAQREVVAMRDIEGWTADEVCSALGISSVNQRVLLHRGRVAVRAMLEDYLS